jgi:hypothetical protein
MVASTIKNMQVPAYEPSPEGVQADEYKGVVADWKNTIAISAEVMRMEEPDDVSMPSMLVEVDITAVEVIVMPAIAVDVAMVMSLMSML